MLTREAREILQEEAIHLFLVEGNHFNCESAEQIGGLLRMRILYPKEGDAAPETFEIEIPLSFVLYTVSAEARAVLGFK